MPRTRRRVRAPSSEPAPESQLPVRLTTFSRNFSTLPPEIHLMISENLEYLQDANALARTNRALFSLLNPYLYRRLSTNITDPAEMPPDGRVTVFHRLATKGMHESLRSVFQAGISPTVPFPYNFQHPIMIAANKGHEKTVQVFLDHGIDPDPATGFKSQRGDFSNPLIAAIQQGHLSVVKALIEHGVNLQFAEKDLSVQQPLYQAVQRGHIEIVKLLLEHGANPMTPNHYCSVLLPTGRRALVENHAIFVPQDTVFTLAARHSMEMLQSVLDKAENPDSIPLGHFDGLLPHAAVHSFDLPLLKHLWKYVRPFDQHWEMYRLHEPVLRDTDLGWGHWNRDIFAQFAYNAGHSDPKGRDIALFLLGHIDIEMVLNCVLAPRLRNIGCLLEGATSLGDTDLMSRLIAVYGSRELTWQYVLSCAVHSSANTGHISATKLLLDHGADPNGRLPSGHVARLSPLLKAIRNGHHDIASLLLDRGADPAPKQTLLSSFNESARFPKSDYGKDLEVLKFMIEKNLVTDMPEEDPCYHKVLSLAATRGEAVFDMTLQYTGITLDRTNCFHQRAMAAAIGKGDVPLLRRFLQAGFDSDYITDRSNRQDKSNDPAELSCLANAAMAENGEEMVDLLLEHGARINLRFGPKKLSPLNVVAQVKSLGVNNPHACVNEVNLLLKKGADPLQYDGLGGNLLRKSVFADSPLMVDVVLRSLSERGADSKVVEPFFKKCDLKIFLAKSWEIHKLLRRWYWTRKYPCP